MKKLIALTAILTLSGCAQYEIVKMGNGITQVEKDMQDYACAEYRGVKRYTEAENVPCKARNIWMKWENVK
jgi:outer membrane lipoprotein-sorting protein